MPSTRTNVGKTKSLKARILGMLVFSLGSRSDEIVLLKREKGFRQGV